MNCEKYYPEPPNFINAFYKTGKGADITMNLDDDRIADMFISFSRFARDKGLHPKICSYIYYCGINTVNCDLKLVSIKCKMDVINFINRIKDDDDKNDYAKYWSLIKACIVGYYSKMKSRQGIFNSILYHYVATKGKIKKSEVFLYERWC